jgi:hypothetical protein
MSSFLRINHDWMDVQFHCLLSQKSLQIVLCTCWSCSTVSRFLARKPARLGPSWYLARAELAILACLAPRADSGSSTLPWAFCWLGSSWSARPSWLVSSLGPRGGLKKKFVENHFLYIHFFWLDAQRCSNEMHELTVAGLFRLITHTHTCIPVRRPGSIALKFIDRTHLHTPPSASKLKLRRASAWLLVTSSWWSAS